MMSDETQNPDQPPMQEPSVLDYVKSLFRFGNAERIQIPAFVEEEKPSAISDQQSAVSDQLAQIHPSSPILHSSAPFPWRSLLALFLALIGQYTFEPPHTSTPLGYAFYIAAFGLLSWAIYLKEWTLFPLAQTSEGTDPLTYRRIALFISIGLGFWSFTIFDDNLFTTGNTLVWYFAIVFFLLAFWLKDKSIWTILQRIGAFLKREPLTFSIPRWTLLLIAATALVFFFRFTQTASLPPEPLSDHAEKILDVYDVSQGQTHIFFIRNTGREDSRCIGLSSLQNFSARVFRISA